MTKARFLIPTPTPAGKTTYKLDGKDVEYAAYLDADGNVMRWSASFPLPAIGSRIYITMNGIGWATVTGYFEQHGWLGVMTKAEDPPRWLKQQNEAEKHDPRYADAPEWRKDGIGCEFGTEIALDKPLPRFRIEKRLNPQSGELEWCVLCHKKVYPFGHFDSDRENAEYAASEIQLNPKSYRSFAEVAQ